MKNKNNLPYLQGGPPEALGIYIGVETIASIIMCCASVIGSIILLTQGQWISLLSIPLTIYSTSLAWKEYQGVKKLRRGEAEGASIIESACVGRRMMIWLMFALAVVVSLITAVSSRNPGAGLLSVMIVVGLSLLVVFPFVNYYKDIEQIMGGYTHREMMTGSPAGNPGKIGHLTALCVTFAVLMLASSIASNFARESYLLHAGLYLYLVAARYLLVNICYRGFLRSHLYAAGDENPVFAPSGYSEYSAFCVLGSIFFGEQVISAVNSIIRYISIGNVFPLILLTVIAHGGCYVLFALALTRRCKDTVLIVAGAIVMVLLAAVSLFGGNSATILTSVLPGMLFYAAVLAAGVIRLRGRAVPNTFRIVMIVLAVLYIAASNVSYVSSIITYGFRYVNWAVFLSRLLDYGIYLAALLALIHALAKPAVSDSGNAEGGPALPDSFNLEPELEVNV